MPPLSGDHLWRLCIEWIAGGMEVIPCLVEDALQETYALIMGDAGIFKEYALIGMLKECNEFACKRERPVLIEK